MKPFVVIASLAVAVLLMPLTSASAQKASKFPSVTSPEVSPERKITFRIQAPKANAVALVAGDIPGGKVKLEKSDNGIWEAAVGPVPAGAYRYQFNVDGVPVIDPRNPATSESNSNTWSLVYVPGSETSDTKDVPHGAVAKVTYWSKTLKRPRRMHIYTPPGYEQGEGKYPVFYLLHGASDSDASWSTVGRAGFILDNLIAASKAKPMTVVMPAGHTGPFRFGAGGKGKGKGKSPFERQMSEFEGEFTNDIKPYVEKNYRVMADRGHRAIAGLSMGGAQTLNIAFDHLDDYGYIGVYSSGIFGIAGGFGGGPPNKQWEERHREVLDNVEAKKGLRLLWFGIGKDDFLLKTSQATVDMLKSHQFNVVSRETGGGHTWMNWREYLAEFAPLLFADK